MFLVRREIFGPEILKGRDYTENSVDGRTILESILGIESERLWTGFTWLSTRTSFRLL
jgi:hypothetical protein